MSGDAMGLKQAFAEIREQEQKSAAENVVSAAAQRKVSREGIVVPAKQPRALGRLDVQAPGKHAKRSDPDFQKVTIYVRKRTRIRAERKWEDAEGGDLSELIEKLLMTYLGMER